MQTTQPPTHQLPAPRTPAATPVMSQHARERCAEMAISTKVAKRIVQDPRRFTYPAGRGSGRMIVSAPCEPRYAVVLSPGAGSPTVVSVLFRTPEAYVRNGRTFSRC